MNGHTPSTAALRWIADAVGYGASIRSVLPLPGATSSALHSIEVGYKGRSLHLVLRQFVDKSWLRIEPDLAKHEAAGLKKAASIKVPTPELIAFDEKGDYCGVPATLMTRLPGTVRLKPKNLDRWLHQLAEALVPLHMVAAPDFSWGYYPYSDLHSLEPPVWSSCSELWEKAIEIVRGPRPLTSECFIHRDYHPNNVLWEGSQVSGIVDWVNSCRGPAGIDVAWCRQNLAQLYGVAEANGFLKAYGSLAGDGFDYHPFWDLIAMIELLPGPPAMYEGWLAFGIAQLEDEVMRRRVDDYLMSVMARF